jgi:hypothetical protein
MLKSPTTNLLPAIDVLRVGSPRAAQSPRSGRDTKMSSIEQTVPLGSAPSSGVLLLKGISVAESDIKCGRDAKRRPPPSVGESSISDPYDHDTIDTKMSRYDEDERPPWYKRRLTWAIGLLLIIIAIAVPIAVVTVRNNQWQNRYPDYSKLNYALSDTCEFLARQLHKRQPSTMANGSTRFWDDIF